MTSWMPFDLLDHLWQSTLFTAAVWVVARAVRTNSARVRYWLWFAASMKFLLPVSVLVSIGERFAWRTTQAPAPVASAIEPVASVIEQVLTPAAATVAAAPAAPITTSAMWLLLLVIWGVGVMLVLSSWWRQWGPISRARQEAQPIDVGDGEGLTILASPSMMEPGVFGIWRPVLLVPEGIRDRLTPVQLGALIAHERCHIAHHDNLTAALHMAVEALFWFHPVVWWLERRLIEERERACDEYVLQSGSSPRDYAEGILEVCRFAKESPPVFVAGVTGSDLGRRIGAILHGRIGRPLSTARAVALGVCATAAVLGPVTTGAVQSSAAGRSTGAQGAADNRPRFEVASIRQNLSGSRSTGLNIKPGGTFTTTNFPLVRLVQFAYEVTEAQVIGGPDWVRADRFDIVAKAAGDANRNQLVLMLRVLLEERFNLRLRTDTREMEFFELTRVRDDGRVGPNLHDCANKNDTSGVSTPEKPFTAPPGGAVAAGACAPMSNVASLAAGRLQAMVQDRTGLAGNWRYNIYFGPDLPDPNSASPDLPSFVTALREQLGLTVQRTRGPVDVLVIESAEKPTEN